MAFADGSQVTATLQGTGNFDAINPTFIKGSLQGTITGGSERCEGAQGFLRGSFGAHLDRDPTVLPAPLHGIISLDGFVRLDKRGH